MNAENKISSDMDVRINVIVGGGQRVEVFIIQKPGQPQEDSSVK
jgi:hypothetical protein